MALNQNPAYLAAQQAYLSRLLASGLTGGLGREQRYFPDQPQTGVEPSVVPPIPPSPLGLPTAGGPISGNLDGGGGDVFGLAPDISGQVGTDISLPNFDMPSALPWAGFQEFSDAARESVGEARGSLGSIVDTAKEAIGLNTNIPGMETTFGEAGTGLMRAGSLLFSSSPLAPLGVLASGLYDIWKESEARQNPEVLGPPYTLGDKLGTFFMGKTPYASALNQYAQTPMQDIYGPGQFGITGPGEGVGDVGPGTAAAAAGAEAGPGFGPAPFTMTEADFGGTGLVADVETTSIGGTEYDTAAVNATLANMFSPSVTVNDLGMLDEIDMSQLENSLDRAGAEAAPPSGPALGTPGNPDYGRYGQAALGHAIGLTGAEALAYGQGPTSDEVATGTGRSVYGWGPAAAGMEAGLAYYDVGPGTAAAAAGVEAGPAYYDVGPGSDAAAAGMEAGPGYGPGPGAGDPDGWDEFGGEF